MEAQTIIDPITFQELKELMGTDFMLELIDAYCLETGQLIQQLRQSLETQDSAAFGRAAHSIKSSSASLGALVFAQQARELEMIGKAGDFSGAGSKLENLASGFVEVKRGLEALKDEP